MVEYTHPASPEHVMKVYRGYCLGEKRIGNGLRREVHCIACGTNHVKRSRPYRTRFYLLYLHEYLAAKRLVLARTNENIPSPSIPS